MIDTCPHRVRETVERGAAGHYGDAMTRGYSGRRLTGNLWADYTRPHTNLAAGLLGSRLDTVTRDRRTMVLSLVLNWLVGRR